MTETPCTMIGGPLDGATVRMLDMTWWVCLPACGANCRMYDVVYVRIGPGRFAFEGYPALSEAVIP